MYIVVTKIGSLEFYNSFFSAGEMLQFVASMKAVGIKFEVS